jgi:hypothetical protein
MLCPGLADLAIPEPSSRPLKAAATAYRNAIENLIAATGFA